MATQNKRKEKDLMKLLMSNYEVQLKDESTRNEFTVTFKGPEESPYEGVFINNKGNMESECFTTNSISL